jgi:hypothetical protein
VLVTVPVGVVLLVVLALTAIPAPRAAKAAPAAMAAAIETFVARMLFSSYLVWTGLRWYDRQCRVLP